MKILPDRKNVSKRYISCAREEFSLELETNPLAVDRKTDRIAVTHGATTLYVPYEPGTENQVELQLLMALETPELSRSSDWGDLAKFVEDEYDAGRMNIKPRPTVHAIG
jgi:hypothetical protein